MRPAQDIGQMIGSRPVLVLGKGPSLTQRALDRYGDGSFVIGINQASRLHRVNLAFFIDMEPFEEVIDDLIDRNCAVVLPWRPNSRVNASRSRPMSDDLMTLRAGDACLKRLDAQDRLFYFHSTFQNQDRATNVYPPNLVSFTSLLRILADIGVTDVATLGIDGGRSYSALLDRNQVTQLKSGYDKQFPILQKISMDSGITLHRADSAPLKVYIGCESDQQLPARVLEHSIRVNTTEQVEFIRLNEAIGSEATAAGRTPFSMQRFFIPELQGREGLAVYLDSDMLVFSNIRDLIALHSEDAALSSAEAPPDSGRRPQYSVMVIDSKKAAWDACALCAAAAANYDDVMFDFDFEPNKARCLPYTWNSLERYEPGVTNLLHYTDMDLQPWLHLQNPLAPLWIAELNRAVRANFISFENVRSAVDQGHIRPGLLWQVENDEADPLVMPRSQRVRDALFAPPHTVGRFTRFNTPVTRAGLAIAKRALHKLRAVR